MFEGPFDFVFTIVHRGIFATVLTGFVTIGLAFAGVSVIPDRLPYAPIPAALVEERMRVEIDAARAQGFGAPERIVVDAPRASARVALEPDTCVAFVAATWGSHRVAWLSVLPGDARVTGDTAYRPDALSTDPTVEGLVASTQHCNGPEPQTVVVEVVAYELTPMEPAASLTGVIQVMRAPATSIGGPDALRRGWLAPAATEAEADADAEAGRPRPAP